MPSPIKPRRQWTAGRVPAAGDFLASNELLINWADGVIYGLNPTTNAVVAWPLGGSGGGSASVNYDYATTAALPATGNAALLYCTTDTGRLYRWTGSVYAEVGPVGGGSSNLVDVPASATASGTLGQYALGGGYVYYAVGLNQWERAATSTWSPFTPATVSGLQLWLDASDASTLYDATSGGSLVAADGGVARWQDKSGNGRHFTQSSSGSRPLRKTSVQGGKDTLLFDGSNDFLEGGDYLDFTAPYGLTFFVVVRRSTSGYSAVFGKYGRDSATGRETGWLLEMMDNSLFRFYVANKDTNVASGVSSSVTLEANSYAVLSVRSTAGSASTTTTLYKGGASVSTTGSVADAAIDNDFAMQIGRYVWTSPGGYFGGSIGEIVVYNAALSNTDRAAVESYLMTKWSIS